MNKSKYFKAIVGILLMAVLGLAKADISEATFTPQGGDTYAAIPEELVKVYVYKPNFKFKVIGVVDARGRAEGGSLLDQLNVLGQLIKGPPTEKQDMELAIKALKSEAAANGADGVLILKSVQVRVSSEITERRIIAAAIRADE